jgi:hypothetical protein
LVGALAGASTSMSWTGSKHTNTQLAAAAAPSAAAAAVGWTRLFLVPVHQGAGQAAGSWCTSSRVTTAVER